MSFLRTVKKSTAAFLAAVLLVNVPFEAALAQAKTTTQQEQEVKSPLWSDFRGNEFNNGITNAKTPISMDESVLSWATRFVPEGEYDPLGAPILVGDDLVIPYNKTLYKVNRFTGAITASTELKGNIGYGIGNPTYADGMIFVALNNRIQALDADTLQSLWVYDDEKGGQPNASIKYANGYIYTGFCNPIPYGETQSKPEQDSDFVCIKADRSATDGKKDAEWKYTLRNGFYYAGACVTDRYVIVGGENGVLLVLDTKNGTLIDTKTDVKGNIRSNISYDQTTNRYYFTSEGGVFYGVTLDVTGKIQPDVKEINLGGPSTSTPVVYNGRAYVGVGVKGAWVENVGQHIAVIDLEKEEIAYTCKTWGYAQSSGLLSTAYEQKDGSVYVYFTENGPSGLIRVLKDKKGQTASESKEYADVLFAPQGEHKQYALPSLITDEYGTLYMKNDSGHLMAVTSMPLSITVENQPTKTQYKNGESFDKTGIKVVANYANGLNRDITNEVSFDTDKLTNKQTEGNVTKEITVSYKNTLYQSEMNASGEYDKKEVSPLTTNVSVTVEPTEVVKPTTEPTVEPTVEPTTEPTVEPTVTPTVKPAAPVKVTAPTAVKVTKVSGTSATSIKVSYNKVSNANGYVIYRADKRNGTYKKLKTITKNTTTSYTDKYKIKTGRTYYYKVVSYKKSGTKTVYGKVSNIKSGKANLKAASITKTSAVSRTKVKLSWKKNSEAHGYVVYQATKKNGSYKKVAVLKKNKYTTTTIKNLKRHKTYYYKVKSYRVVDGKKVFSGYSNVKSVKTKR